MIFVSYGVYGFTMTTLGWLRFWDEEDNLISTAQPSTHPPEGPEPLVRQHSRCFGSGGSIGEYKLIPSQLSTRVLFRPPPNRNPLDPIQWHPSIIKLLKNKLPISHRRLLLVHPAREAGSPKLEAEPKD